ncbi:beta/gamma crystallin-related protein [Aequorivita echinoideorum]|uniref:Beta/gamma crystallin 'Greek key' domain-containing protein n=1 Tax=Aequorivita echinoideorum TaxID=1549647 RepID=A0ABS5S1I8_9FLAO|nr:beta/gamma crystallin-related protein [Aequorivita echinoideorum]MBT0607057.1 hypothetical protein [Aequorivita echinoideorum]
MKTQFQTHFKNISMVAFCLFIGITATAQIKRGPIRPGDPNPIAKVTLYDAIHFGGEKREFTGKTPYLNDFDNRASSISVPLGKKVTFYDDRGFQGRKVTLHPGNYDWLNDWNDRITSIEVTDFDPNEAVAYLFQNSGEVTNSQIFQSFTAGEYDLDALLCNDCFKKMIVYGNLEVYPYDAKNFNGRNRENDPFKEGTWILNDYGFHDNISSIKVRSLQYALLKTVLSNRKVLDEGEKEAIGVNTTSENINVPGSPEYSATVSDCRTASATQTFDTSVTTGISFSVTTGFTAGVEGVASSSIEYTFATNLESTFSQGNSSTIEKEQCFTFTQPIPVPTGCKGMITGFIKPQTIQYDITKHYVPVDAEGNQIPGGKPKIIMGKLVVEKNADAGFEISLAPPCGVNVSNGNSNNNSSNNQNSSSSNSQDISKVIVADNNGNTVGYFVGKDGKWEEQDAQGNAKFQYSADIYNNNDSKIILNDLNRQNVKIHLDFSTNEVLYEDLNNSPFMIYKIKSKS